MNNEVTVVIRGDGRGVDFFWGNELMDTLTVDDLMDINKILQIAANRKLEEIRRRIRVANFRKALNQGVTTST